VDVITVVPGGVASGSGRLIRELDRVPWFSVYDGLWDTGEASGIDVCAPVRDFFNAGWMVVLSSEAGSVRLEICQRCITPDEEAAAAGLVIDALTAAGY